MNLRALDHLCIAVVTDEVSLGALVDGGRVRGVEAHRALKGVHQLLDSLISPRALVVVVILIILIILIIPIMLTRAHLVRELVSGSVAVHGREKNTRRGGWVD